MSLDLIEFDIAEYLTDDESLALYVKDAVENEDAHGIVHALGDVVAARGGPMQFSSQRGLTEEIVRRAIQPQEFPDFNAILKVLRSLGIRLSAQLMTKEVATSKVAA